MRTYLTAVALAAAFAHPASAITFPTLTTIYVGTVVRDSGGAPGVGSATTVHCSNVSGVATQIRLLVLDSAGLVVGSRTATVGHGQSYVVATRSTNAYEEHFSMNTGVLSAGTINIESLQSGVFCTAVTIDAAPAIPDGVPVPLVRVNPHPGTVE